MTSFTKDYSYTNSMIWTSDKKCIISRKKKTAKVKSCWSHVYVYYLIESACDHVNENLLYVVTIFFVQGGLICTLVCDNLKGSNWGDFSCDTAFFFLYNVLTTFRFKHETQVRNRSSLVVVGLKTLSKLTLGSPRETLTGARRLLLVTGFWLAVSVLVLCSHWEKSPAPWGPCGPVGPCAPCEPLNPWRPMTPWGPCVPLNPRGPAGPIGPWEPLRPGGPIGPWSLLTFSTCEIWKKQ